jgi:superfamily I DNA/RNA helicase
VKEKIQEEKDGLKNDLTKTKETKAILENKLQNREEEQKKREEEQKKREEELQNQIKELSDRIEKAESAPQPAIVAPIPPSNSPFARRIAKMKSIDVEEKSMDDDQIDLIEKTLDKSMLVSGCAGSGKSVIAMHKAQQILEMGGDVIVISYTKSLCEFMECGKTASNLKERYYYHYQWKQQLMPQADYIIVDEIQDFTREEIQEFIKAARKNYFFFGDTAQSIYGGLKTTMSIKEISEITGLQPLMLYNNYRLPKPVAKITQQYIGIDVNPYSETAYKSTETNLPHIVQIDTMEAQAKVIIETVKKQQDKTIGILVSDNTLVQKFMDIFYQENFLCEAKYNDGDSSNYTLDFSTQNPKLMTYHSAKGLQFGTVIIPMFDDATSNDRKKTLYVAMTRTYRDLFVLYSGELKTPLKEIDKSLYLSNF